MSAHHVLRVLGGLTLVGALALLIGSFTPDMAGAAPALSCPGAGGKTVVRTKSVRVFTLPGRFSTNRDYYACLYREKRAFRITLIDYEGPTVNRRSIRLAGRYVALVQSAAIQDTSSEFVVVRDLVTGRAAYAGPRPFGMVRNLVLKRTGSAAFIYEPSDDVRQLRVASATGDMIVDQGQDIDPGSLELSPDRRSVTYLKAGERRSAPLRSSPEPS